MLVGGYVKRSFLTADEELGLMDWIDSQTWDDTMSRRVQHYGWAYNYKARSVQQDSYIGALPDPLALLAGKIAGQNIMDMPDQVIINEYEPGQGIGAHVDCEPCFGPVVASLGLGSDVQLDFVKGRSTVPVRHRQRDLVVMEGAARYDWQHSIARRREDPEFDIVRARRVSLTFRTVKVL